MKLLNKFRKLEKATSSVGFFTFRRYKRRKCKVVNIVDGDTVDVVFRFHRKLIKLRIRLIGIDTPEIRTSNEIEKQKGLEAKEYLTQILAEHDNYMYIKCDTFDNFGRTLATLYTPDGENVNMYMIDMGFAKEY